MEATSGFEPLNRGFADLPLNHLGTSPRDGPPQGVRRVVRPVYVVVAPRGFEPRFADSKSAVLPLDEGAAGESSASAGRPDRASDGILERETGFEPATSTLARLRSAN